MRRPPNKNPTQFRGKNAKSCNTLTFTTANKPFNLSAYRFSLYSHFPFFDLLFAYSCGNCEQPAARYESPASAHSGNSQKRTRHKAATGTSVSDMYADTGFSRIHSRFSLLVAARGCVKAPHAARNGEKSDRQQTHRIHDALRCHFVSACLAARAYWTRRRGDR